MSQNRFGDLFQKAFYLGLGFVDYAQEKAGSTLQELRERANKLADEMVRRGEMNAEEARRFVDDLMREAETKQGVGSEQARSGSTDTREPRRIEILDDDPSDRPSAAADSTGPETTPPSEATAKTDTETGEPTVDELREQVEALRRELQQLQ